jgi:uncharacterized surface protein with fasciclin (FAS1) repeats
MPRLNRKTALLVLAVNLIAAAAYATAHAEVRNDNIVYIGGALNNPIRPAIENLSYSRDHETFVAALRQAGLEDILRTSGSYTVFAPTTAAFNKLPPAIGDNFLHPENNLKLAHLMNYHIVAGRFMVVDIAALARANHGTVVLKTIGGDTLAFTENAQDILEMTDDYGNTARILIADVPQSNGIVHVIDTVLVPASVGY